RHQLVLGDDRELAFQDLHGERFNAREHRFLFRVAVAVPADDLEGIALAPTADRVSHGSGGTDANAGGSGARDVQMLPRTVVQDMAWGCLERPFNWNACAQSPIIPDRF